jgi:hypothetical protein
MPVSSIDIGNGFSVGGAPVVVEMDSEPIVIPVL